MKDYKKPVVLANEEMAEGVFASSGANCWTGSIMTTQTWNGEWHVYEVSLTHTNTVSHFSESCTVQYTFSSAITQAKAEGDGNYEVSISGNVVTVRRIHHANGEYSGDNVTYKLFAYAADQATTEALDIRPGMTILNCEKTGTPNYPNID